MNRKRRTTAVQFSMITTIALAGGIWLVMSLMRIELGIIVGPPVFLALLLASGGLWGAGISKIMRHKLRPLLIAGAKSWGIIVFIFAVLLEVVNGFQTAIGRALNLSPHAVFSLSFLISAFLITGIAARSMAIALGRTSLANELAGVSGACAAFGFLLVNLLMLSQGWELGRWMGGRSVMVTLMVVGNAGAALAGGAAMGWLLGQQEEFGGATEAIDRYRSRLR